MPSPGFRKELPARQREGDLGFLVQRYCLVMVSSRLSTTLAAAVQPASSAGSIFPSTFDSPTRIKLARLRGFGAVSSDTAGREIDDYPFFSLPKGPSRWRAET